MGTEKGSRAVADAIKDIELEKIRGPGDTTSVKLGSFWEDQVFTFTSQIVHRLIAAQNSWIALTCTGKTPTPTSGLEICFILC